MSTEFGQLDDSEYVVFRLESGGDGAARRVDSVVSCVNDQRRGAICFAMHCDMATWYTKRASRIQWETSPRCMNSRNAVAALFNSTLAAQAIPTSMVGTLSASDVASTRRPSSDHGR